MNEYICVFRIEWLLHYYIMEWLAIDIYSLYDLSILQRIKCSILLNRWKPKRCLIHWIGKPILTMSIENKGVSFDLASFFQQHKITNNHWSQVRPMQIESTNTHTHIFYVYLFGTYTSNCIILKDFVESFNSISWNQANIYAAQFN